MEDTKSRFKRICVFCGSSSGKKATYQEAAVELGKELVMEFSKIYFYPSVFHVLFQNPKFWKTISNISPFCFWVQPILHCFIQWCNFGFKKIPFFFPLSFLAFFPCQSSKGIFFYALFMFLINWVDFCSGTKQFRNLVVSLSFERGHMIVLLIK